MGQSELDKTDVNVSADRQIYPVHKYHILASNGIFLPHNVSQGSPSENFFALPNGYFLSAK